MKAEDGVIIRDFLTTIFRAGKITDGVYDYLWKETIALEKRDISEGKDGIRE